MFEFRRSLAVALVACPMIAAANTNELYGMGPRAAAMGGAMTAEANDFSGVFYNPSLLVNSKESNFGVSVNYYKPTATVTKSSGAAELDCASCQPRESLATTLGFVFPLGGRVKNRIAIGLGLSLPATVLVRVSSPPRNQPYWYQYDSAHERFVLNVGAGVKIVDWLNIGAGVQVLSDLVGQGAAVKVDLFAKEVRTSSINSYLANRAGPTFALSLTPYKRLRLGATFRWEMKLVYEIPASVDLQGIGALNFALTGTLHYSPHTFQFGAAYDVLDNLTIALDGEWANWSAAPSPYMNVKMGLAGATLSALGLDTAFNIESAQQPPGLSDTMSGRLGIEWRVNDRVALRGGGFYRPTMVPRQDTPGTNLMDATAIGLTAGLGFSFMDPLDVFENPLKIDLSGHGTFITSRDARKETTDSVPSYSYSATVGGFSVGIRYDY